MMKALHKVNTMEKKKQLYLQKVNIHLFINLVILQSVTSMVTCHLYMWSKWNPHIKKGTRTLFNHRGSHPML
jgi:hypothetical protein